MALAAVPLVPGLRSPSLFPQMGAGTEEQKEAEEEDGQVGAAAECPAGQSFALRGEAWNPGRPQ